MGRILSYAGKNKKYLISAIIVLFISTIFGIIPFFLLNKIIMSLVEDTFVLSETLGLILWIGGCLILKAACFGGGLGLSHIGAFNILYNIRTTFSKNMAHHPMGHIMDEGTGKYKKTFVEDISSLESALAHMIPEGVPYICGVLLTIITITVIDYRLGIATLIMIPISMSPMGYMMKVGLKKMPEYYSSRDKLNQTLVEYVSGMEVVKVFNKTSSSYGRLKESAIFARDFALDWCKVTWKSTSVLYSILPCTLLVPLPIGVYLFINEKMTFSDLTLIIMLLLSIGEPLIKLINFMPSIPMLDYAIKKVEAVFVHEDVKSGEFNEISENCDVEFKNVQFKYENKEVIHGIDLNIKQNSICALVGPSGGGKSTLAKLLMHFWDLNGGSISIGGRAITEFTFENLMNHISYVSQENTLFEGTVLENIALAREGISREGVIEACKKAKCHDFIMNLEDGYDTNVGTLGGKLSGGERQRITIARAIIKDAPIVVLDEATAFADAENEFLIQEALSELLIGKTVLIIAHKLHTITEVDQIVVLVGGNIEAVGRHEELLEKSQTYQSLWEQNQLSVNWDLGGEAR